jgi:hypothetical protein
MPGLLAIDLGLRSGLAWFDQEGRLVRYRSASFADRARFKLGVVSLLQEGPGVVAAVAEGDARLGKVWARALERQGVELELIAAERWRPALFSARERRSKEAAKRAADELARRVIGWSGCARPTSLTDDAAEAICVGLWAVVQRGWLVELPEALRPR